MLNVLNSCNADCEAAVKGGGVGGYAAVTLADVGAGTLPAEWGTPSHGDWTDVPFPLLKYLEVSTTSITGSMPASWGINESFPSIGTFAFDNTMLSGELPAFNQPMLQYFSAGNTSLNGSLDTFWTSLVPLELISLANTSMSGSLPDTPTSFPDLLYLDIDGNRMHGTIPLSWLQEGQILSHVLWLNLGNVWDASIRQDNWREQLCLSPQLYNADVLGQQFSQFAAVQSGVDETSLVYGVGDPHGDVSFYITDRNQFTSVQAICANRSVLAVLLALWLIFAAFLVGIFLVYWVCVCRRGRPAPAKLLPLITSVVYLRSTKIAAKLYDVLIRIAGLVFYYYDLINNIVLLAQVWGTWPGAILLTIFFVHFAVTGSVVAFQCICRRFLEDETKLSSHKTMLFTTLALLISPGMMVVVFLLDTAAFLKENLEVAKRLPRPQYLPAFKPSGLQTFAKAFGRLSQLHLDWIDLECYDSMHNAAAAIFQTLPTLMLNSALFALGNKPTHGIYFSDSLIVSALVGLFLAILKTAMTVLWRAYLLQQNAIITAARLMTGTLLAKPP